MDIIYHYDGLTGLPLYQGVADANPLDPESPLMPAYSTQTKWPTTSALECARYLTPSGDVPAHHADGAWVVQPDWRGIDLWSIDDGREIEITEPNVTPADKNATVVPYPGPGYVWRGEQWQEDPALKYQLAEQAAERELSQRHAEATTEIERIQPAVDGRYAKPEDIELLSKWQRCRYELPDVRLKPGWPESPQWSEKPETAV